MKYLFLLASLSMLVACNTAREADIDRLEANKTLIIRLNDAQNAWDVETMQSLMAPDVKRHCQATPEADVNSSDDYIALLRMWQDIIPDAHQTINRIIAEDDMVAVHATLVGTQTGPMGEIPATGNRFESNALAMFRIADGQVAEVWVEWDNVTILRQLGVFPPQTPPEDQPS